MVIYLKWIDRSTFDFDCFQSPFIFYFFFMTHFALAVKTSIFISMLSLRKKAHFNSCQLNAIEPINVIPKVLNNYKMAVFHWIGSSTASKLKVIFCLFLNFCLPGSTFFKLFLEELGIIWTRSNGYFPLIMSVIITAISLVHGYEGEICVHGYEREIRVRRRRSIPIPRLMNDFKNKKNMFGIKMGSF